MTDLEQSPRLQRIGHYATGFVAGGVLGLIGSIMLWRMMSSDAALPELHRKEWLEARRRWETAALHDYDIKVSVSGRQAATYAVQVRDGEVVGATRNSEPLPQQRTWSTWTVEGMFETISRDLDSVEKHLEGRADASTPQLQLRALFHSELGYPQQYLRTEMVRFGANVEVSWEVVKFDRW